MFGYRSRHGMRTDLMLQVGLAAQIPVQLSPDPVKIQDQIIAYCLSDGETFLDALDATLNLANDASAVGELRRSLHLGGSAWTVSREGRSMQRRVAASAQAAMEQATSVQDVVSAELNEAWAKVYGRDPDSSDAWDHAIKALEEALIPIVVPNKAKANLGSVAGELKAQPGRWNLGLESKGIGGVETLEAMLRLVWPNPDRHGGRQPGRAPSLEEAGAIVHLAITIVQWGRAGMLVGG
jgi:hypothetical protein